MKFIKSFIPKTAFITLLLFNAGNFLFAQKQSEVAVVKGTDHRIKFAGSKEDMLIFEVQLDSLPATGSVLSILDENNNHIFEEKISATTHNRRYKILQNNMELLTFKVSGKDFYYDQSFTIKHKTVEMLEVSRVK